MVTTRDWLPLSSVGLRLLALPLLLNGLGCSNDNIPLPGDSGHGTLDASNDQPDHDGDLTEVTVHDSIQSMVFNPGKTLVVLNGRTSTADGRQLNSDEHYVEIERPTVISSTHRNIVDFDFNPGPISPRLPGSILPTSEGGFSNRYGAGAFEWRRLDSSGMDSPWGYAPGSVCVDHGEEVMIQVNNGNPLSSDVEDLKGVIWWYDKGHENDGVVDDIDLYLRNSSGIFRSSARGGAENKERVYHGAAGGQTWSFGIYGYGVTSDDQGCGSNSMKVYYAFFYEDDDRDDSDGPSASEIQPEGLL